MVSSMSCTFSKWMCVLSQSSLVAPGILQNLTIFFWMFMSCRFPSPALVFKDWIFLCGYLRTLSVDQTSLELRDPLVSASQVLELEACTTTPGPAATF